MRYNQHVITRHPTYCSPQPVVTCYIVSRFSYPSLLALWRRRNYRTHSQIDKTGEADSSSLFAAIRTAYENLATSQHRAAYRPALRKSTSCDASDSDFRWEVKIVGSASKDLPAPKFSRPASCCRFPNAAQTKEGGGPKPHSRCGDHQDRRVPVGGDCISTPEMGSSRASSRWRQGVRRSDTDVGEGGGQTQEHEDLAVEEGGVG